MSGVIKLVDRTNSAMVRTPEDILKEALENTQDGEWRGRRKIFVMSVLEDGDGFDIACLVSGMDSLVLVGLLEYAKAEFIKGMKE